jgi:uncharacterized protein
MSQQIERRFVKGGQVRAKKDDKPSIDGVGAVYDQDYDNGWFIERMKPGTFKRAIDEKQDVRCLFNHDPNNVLGRTKSGTLRISDASDGLHYECDTNPDTRIAADVHSMIDRGDVDGCSISFVVRSQAWREETNDKGETTYIREIEDVDLFDVGPVTFPAYEQTSVTARSLWPNGVPEEIRSHVPKLRAVKPAQRDDADACTCACQPCQDGNCSDCSCEGCSSENCCNEDCRCGDGERMRVRHAEKRLRLAEAESF